MNRTTAHIFGAALALCIPAGLAAESSPVASASQSADVDGNTPLHLAVLRGDAEAVDSLLDHGADAAAINTAGATPLHYANANERIVTALLAHGAPVNAVSKLGNTPLLSAVNHSNSFVVAHRLIEAGANANYRAGNEISLVLCTAIAGGDIRTVELLLDHGAEVNPAEGNQPLFQAAFFGRIAIAKLLLARGANVIPRDPYYEPLGGALWTRQYDVAELLINHGADVNAKMDFPSAHRPNLVLSAYNDLRDPAVTRMMIEHGADINVADGNGETALSYALKRGSDSPLVAYLREAGAKDSPQPRRTKTIPSREVPTELIARQAMVRNSVQRAIDLIQPSSKVFLQNPVVHDQQKCTSCHQQHIPGIAISLARERGLRVDDLELGRALQAVESEFSASMESTLQSQVPFVISSGFIFDFLHAYRFVPNAAAEAALRSLLVIQGDDGSWVAPVRRSPMEDGPLMATASAIRALQLYPPAGREQEAKIAVGKASHWLASQEPKPRNELVFQLLGLAWSNEPSEHLQPYIEKLLALQSSDGGWAQFSSLESDAWATGTTLVALQSAGLPVSHAAYRRGVEFLLRTQFDDGSWWVRSRTIPTQNHFNGKFPHGKDQWISAAGTSWAMTALLLTLEPTVDPTSLPSTNELIAKFEAAPKEKSAKELAAISAEKIQSATESGAMDFVRDIKPILERSCVGCHSGEKAKGSFSLASRETLLKGGQSGEPAIVPGYADESQLLQFVSGQVEDLEMPPLNRRKKYPALSPEELDRLHTWIDAGAPWPASSSIEKEIAPAPTASTEKPASAASPGA